MELEEHSLDDSLVKRCEVCGTELSDAEIEAARDSGGPFLCAVHADEAETGTDADPASGEDEAP